MNRLHARRKPRSRHAPALFSVLQKSHMVALVCVLGLIFLLTALPPVLSRTQQQNLDTHLKQVARDSRSLVSVLKKLPLKEKISMLEGLNSGQLQLLAPARSVDGPVHFGPFKLGVFILKDQVTLIQDGQVVWSQAFRKGPIPEKWQSLLPLTTEHMLVENPLHLAPLLQEWSTRQLNAGTWMVPLSSRQVLAVTALQLKQEALWGPLLLLGVTMLLAWTVWVFLPALAGSVLVSSWLARREARRLGDGLKHISRKLLRAPSNQHTLQDQYNSLQELNHMEQELLELGQRFESALQGLQSKMGQQQDFLHSISHDLRTPLSHILAFSEDLQDRLQDSPLEKKVRIIHREALALSRMVSDVFDVLRFEHPEFRLKLRTVEVSSVLEHQLERFQSDARSKHIHLGFSRPETEVLIQADPERLGQVMGNLLSNALRYTPAEGTIELRLAHDITSVQIQVLDTGAGVATEHLPHLFERFYRADGASAERHSGLGLAICKQLVEQMGGQISVDSVEGGGSTFTIQLPRDR